MFGEPGAEIIYPDPGFPIYRSMIEYTGATPVPMALREENGFAFSAEEVLSQITPQTQPDHRQQPGQSDRRACRRRARSTSSSPASEKHPDVAVMSDEIYSQMLYDGAQARASCSSYPEIRDRLILLDGWSKTYAMTGWRLGFSVWPKALVENARARASTATPASMRRRSTPASPRSKARRTRCTRWWPRSTSGGRSWSRCSTSCPASPAPLPRARSMRSPTSRHRLEGKGARSLAAGGGRRCHRRRAQLRHSRRGLYAVQLCQFDREHSARPRPHGRISRQPEGRIAISAAERAARSSATRTAVTLAVSSFRA